MKKKVVMILIFVLIIVIGSYVLLSFNSKEKNKSNQNEIREENNSPLETQNIKLKEYIDPSGFKFSYPENFNLKRNNTTSDLVYSSLSLNLEKEEGKITILAESSNLKNIDESSKQIKSSSDTAALKKLKLGDLDALQNTSNNKIVTIALDKGVLFTITATISNNKLKWQQANEQIISSFKFSPPESTGQQSSSDSTTDDVTFEGEEVVE